MMVSTTNEPEPQTLETLKAACALSSCDFAGFSPQDDAQLYPAGATT